MRPQSWQHLVRLFISSILLTMLVACGASDSATTGDDSAGKVKVVATTGQISDSLANIGGDVISLVGLFGPGVDPHLYVPTEGDVGRLAEAEVIVYNGVHLEAQMVRVMNEMEKRGITVVPIGDRFPTDRLLSWDTNYPHDPHIWNDLMLWKLGVEIMRDTLIEVDPDHADLYRENTVSYLAQIDETHQYIQEQIDRIPPDKRVMITAHDAFGYFARAYGMEVRGLQGISTESEASTADVQELATFIVERKIPAIFVESSVPPRTIEAVQAAVQAKGFEVKIGGTLFSDALGSPGTAESTYIGMLRYNAKTLADALSE